MTQDNLLLWVLWHLKGRVALPTSSHTPPALQRESYTDLDRDEQSRRVVSMPLPCKVKAREWNILRVT